MIDSSGQKVETTFFEMAITYCNSKFATQLSLNMHCRCFLEFQYQNTHLNKRFLS